eukprot:388969_1
MAELLNQSNCNDSSNTEKFVEWKEKAKTKLKNTIESNLNRRNIKLAQIVTATTKHMYSAQCLISASLSNIFTRVDEWRGVNISAMHTAPKTFEEYYRRADNWWNRMKAQWLGDYYFYPFFHTDLHQFMANIPNNHSTSNEHMYFRILHAIFNTEIHYPRARPYPLILHTALISTQPNNGAMVRSPHGVQRRRVPMRYHPYKPPPVSPPCPELFGQCQITVYCDDTYSRPYIGNHSAAPTYVTDDTFSHYSSASMMFPFPTYVDDDHDSAEFATI